MAGRPSCCPTNSVEALKAAEDILGDTSWGQMSYDRSLRVARRTESAGGVVYFQCSLCSAAGTDSGPCALRGGARPLSARGVMSRVITCTSRRDPTSNSNCRPSQRRQHRHHHRLGSSSRRQHTSTRYLTPPLLSK